LLSDKKRLAKISRPSTANDQYKSKEMVTLLFRVMVPIPILAYLTTEYEFAPMDFK
jgi:hypothetical protein